MLCNVSPWTHARENVSSYIVCFLLGSTCACLKDLLQPLFNLDLYYIEREGFKSK